MNVQSFLKEREFPFEMLTHHREYVASRTAHALHVPGANFAKTVMMRVDGRPTIVVLGASSHVDGQQVRRAFGANSAELMREAEFVGLFPDCEPGAVPPFGSQYGLETIVDDLLADDEHIVFDGNTHHEAVYMRFADYEQIEHPRVAHVSA